MILTAHFSSREFGCHDGTPYPLEAVDDEDPDARPWSKTRLLPLCNVLEVIRAAAGGSPLVIDSGYRTLAYDQRLYDADAGAGNVATPQGSQHPKGRAADIRHTVLSAKAMHDLILRLYKGGSLPRLGGLGLYARFVHVDVRPHTGHLAQWQGTRLANA